MMQLICDERNEIAGLDRFLERWDASSASMLGIGPTEHAPRSRFGNINVGARPWTAPSLLLPRGHAEFYRHVEPGVRAWVRWFVANGFTTYTSCEGHNYGTESEPDFRHVGILLREEHERGALLDLYEPLSLPEDSSCALAFLDHTVVSDGVRFDALDLYLIPMTGCSPDKYFRDLDSATASLLLQLEVE